MIPEKWALKILSVLQVKYGQSFTKKYDGCCDQDWVVADWAATIGTGDQKVDGEAIQFALQNLPEWPPNSISFQNLCRQYTRPIQYVAFIPPLDRNQASKSAEMVALAQEAKLETDQLRWARNPLSWFAAKCVAELIQQRDGRFIVIGQKLVAEKHRFASQIALALDSISLVK